jgi:hypothetical protein
MNCFQVLLSSFEPLHVGKHCCDEQGLADIARHVIHRLLNPRLLSQMASCDAASNPQLGDRYCPPCHPAHLNPRVLIQMAFYDVASYICLALTPGITLRARNSTCTVTPQTGMGEITHTTH